MVEVRNNVNINSSNAAQNSAALESRFAEVKNKQGFLGTIWNEVKEATNTGVSESDCESMLLKYKKGEVSFDEAIEYINSYEQKQDSMSDLGANIITGIGAIALATAAAGSGPIGWAFALAKGAPIGAAIKSLVKFVDRATNNTKNDEFDMKQIAKDAISGAVTGTASAVSSGVGIGIKAGKIGVSVSNGIKCGAECGAIAGATSYITDTALDKDKYFNIQDLVKNTAVSTFVSGTVGGVVGAGMYGLSSNVGKETSKTLTRTIVDDSTASSSRKVLGEAERSAMAIA